MATPDNFDWDGHDKVTAQAREIYAEYAKGRRDKAPGAFRALDMIINHLPEVNPVLSALVLGWIVGAFRHPNNTEEFPFAEHDESVDAWYVRVSAEDVDHTTEAITHVDWTRDGKLVGIELLPGEPPRLLLKQDVVLTPDELKAFEDGLNEALKAHGADAVIVPADDIEEVSDVSFARQEERQEIPTEVKLVGHLRDSCPTCWPRPCDLENPRTFCKRAESDT